MTNVGNEGLMKKKEDGTEEGEEAQEEVVIK